MICLFHIKPLSLFGGGVGGGRCSASTAEKEIILQEVENWVVKTGSQPVSAAVSSSAHLSILFVFPTKQTFTLIFG